MSDTASTDCDDAQSVEASDTDAQDASGPRPKGALEWAVSGAGALLVLFVLGFFVYEWAAGASGPAALRVSLGTPTVRGATAEVPVEVHNDGQRVAEVAVVEVCAGEASCGEVTFAYVPYQSRVRGVIGLEAPLRAPLTSRVVSYVEP